MDVVGEFGPLALLENRVERLPVVGPESRLGRLRGDSARDALRDMSPGVFSSVCSGDFDLDPSFLTSAIAHEVHLACVL